MEPIIALKYFNNDYQNTLLEFVVLEKSYFSKLEIKGREELVEVFFNHYPENGLYFYIVDKNGFIYSITATDNNIALKQISDRIECKISGRNDAGSYIENWYNQNDRYNHNSKLEDIYELLEFAKKRKEKL